MADLNIHHTQMHMYMCMYITYACTYMFTRTLPPHCRVHLPFVYLPLFMLSSFPVSTQ